MHGLYWNSSSFRLLQNKIKFYVNNANTNYGEYVQIAKQIQAEIKELTHTKKTNSDHLKSDKRKRK